MPNGKKLVQVTTRGQPTRRFVTASANSSQPEVVDLDGAPTTDPPTKDSTPQSSAQAKNSSAQANTSSNAGRAKVPSKPATDVINMLKETQNTITAGDAGTVVLGFGVLDLGHSLD